MMMAITAVSLFSSVSSRIQDENAVYRVMNYLSCYFTYYCNTIILINGSADRAVIKRSGEIMFLLSKCHGVINCNY